MKQHAEALVMRLKDPQRWPGFGTVDHLQQLQELAGEAKTRATTDGYLAAMLIIHQLSEELIKVLIDDAYFYTQLKLYPLPFEPKNTKNTKNRMFGHVLADLKSAVWFQNKKYIVEKAERLNTIRIGIVHKLTTPGALKMIERDAVEAWNLYCALSFLATEAHMVFQEEFKDFCRNEDWPPKDAVILRDDGSILD